MQNPLRFNGKPIEQMEFADCAALLRQQGRLSDLAAIHIAPGGAGALKRRED